MQTLIEYPNSRDGGSKNNGKDKQTMKTEMNMYVHERLSKWACSHVLPRVLIMFTEKIQLNIRLINK